MTTVTKTRNIIKKHKIIVSVLLVLFILLFSMFVYKNIVVPWPYREALEACLNNAENFSNQQQIDDARNVCFRTYPHFN